MTASFLFRVCRVSSIWLERVSLSLTCVCDDADHHGDDRKHPQQVVGVHDVVDCGNNDDSDAAAASVANDPLCQSAGHAAGRALSSIGDGTHFNNLAA